MILVINTTNFGQAEFKIVSKEKIIKQTFEIAFNENYKTLELLERFLKSNKLKFNQISKIITASGPGSFTGIRVGTALGQSLALGLNIPVIVLPNNKVVENFLKLDKSEPSKNIKLHYGQKPNITKAKKKKA